MFTGFYQCFGMNEIKIILHVFIFVDDLHVLVTCSMRLCLSGEKRLTMNFCPLVIYRQTYQISGKHDAVHKILWNLNLHLKDALR